MISEIGSGGQGKSLLVHRHNEPENFYFLKMLRKQNIKSCRERMFGEVCRYETLDFSGIPKLIESNAYFFKNPEYNLYLVTEYIIGSCLNNHKITHPINAIKCILRICEIISYCHSHDVVEWRRGISPPRSPRTGHEPLDSSGSCYPIADLTPHFQ